MKITSVYLSVTGCQLVHGFRWENGFFGIDAGFIDAPEFIAVGSTTKHEYLGEVVILVKTQLRGL